MRAKPEIVLSLIVLLVLLVLALDTGCGGPGTEATPIAPETFAWRGETIQFAAPQSPWSRMPYQAPGRSGLQFMLGKGVNGLITVSDVSVGQMNSKIVMRGLLDRLDRSSRIVIDDKIRSSFMSEDTDNVSEREIAPKVNAALTEALALNQRGRSDELVQSLTTAMQHFDQLDYSLDEAVSPVDVRADRFSEPGQIRIGERKTSQIAGAPSLSVDWSRPAEDRLRRNVYILHDNHLFVLEFSGDESGLETFESIVGSIAFPSDS